jgi:outer membrane receptor protein involved in Fe transport
LDGRLRTLVGYRYDDIEVDYFDRRYKIAMPRSSYRNLDYTPETANAIIDDEANYHHLSPTIGALYWITNEVGFFANYAESIQSPTEIDLDPFGELLPAVTGEGYEFGLRFDLFDGKLNGQISSFYIEKENDKIVNYDYRLNEVLDTPEIRAEFPQYFNPNNGRLVNDALPGKRLAGDKSRAEGVELEFYYNPNRNLSFIVSYAYNNLDAIEIADGVNPRFSEVWGQAPHNALLIGRYKFTSGALKGLTVGANQSFRSSSSIGEWYIEESTDPITNASQGTWYEVKFDPEYVTSAFLNYQMKLGKGRNKRDLYLALRVNNLFDDTDLINRNKGAFHRASREYLFSASLQF